MRKGLKITLITAASLLAVLVLTIVGYVIYVFAAYYRLEDNLALEWEEKSDKVVDVNGNFNVLTYNIGFGAYSPDFTFFMDGGKESVAKSKEAVITNVSGAMNLTKNYSPDFLLVQEVDLDATRSYHVNEFDIFKQGYTDYENVFAQNYDSPYLFYPFNAPHGKSLAGMTTMSKYSVVSSIRRSLPISTGFSKLFDLDRCYSITEYKVSNGKNLFVFNVHLSAYGGSPEIRSGQINMLFSDMKAKYDNGDYVICGGDFNHDMTDETQNLGNENATGDFEWAQKFPFEEIDKSFSFARNYVDKNIPTARNCDIEYIKGKTQVFILDGFFVSNNVVVNSVQNVDSGFLYSDHNPVVMNFAFVN